MTTQRDANGRFGAGNPGNRTPHNANPADRDLRSLTKDLRKTTKPIVDLLDAAEPMLLALALEKAETDDAVLAGVLQLMAARVGRENLAALERIQLQAELLANPTPTH